MHRCCINRAYASIRGGSEAPLLWGKICFTQEPHSVLVSVRVRGLPENNSGFYGLHIHDGTSCCGEQFSAGGTHFNPTEDAHPNHEGDLPPLLKCGDGAYLCVRTDRFRVCDIIGKTVMIHSKADDFHSQPAGNAGNKIACGVIYKTS